MPRLQSSSRIYSTSIPHAGPESSVQLRSHVVSNLAHNAPAEIQLLFACARTTADSVTQGRIKEFLAQALDWEFVLQKAHQNCVTPLLYWNLSRANASLVPHEVMERLHRFFTSHVRRNLHQTAELIALLRMFDESDIPALPFKGPTLAAGAYGNICLRQFNDLDILVRRSDLTKTIKLLMTRGFKRAYSGPSLPQLTSADLRRKDLALISHDGSVLVELHWRLSGTHFGFPLDIDDLWGRLRRVEIAGSSVRCLTPSELLIYLCVHGSRHGWERLQWVCDVAEHLRSNPELEWPSIMQQARKIGCERSVMLALFLTQELLNAELPPFVRKRLRQDSELRALALHVYRRLFREPKDSLRLSDWYLYHLGVKERSRDKIRLHVHYALRYLRLALRPNRRDHALVDLPTSFSFLYYLLRPFRLLNDRLLFSRRREN